MNVNNQNEVGLTLAATEVKSVAVAAITAGSDSAPAEMSMGALGAATGITIGSASYLTPGTLTANDTNYVTITVYKRTAGGAGVAIAQATTKTSASGGTGNWVAFTPVTIQAIAGAFVSAGDAVTATIVHTAGGVAVPAGVLELFMSVN